MNMKLRSLVKRVENPEYTSKPVISLPYGLAPSQTRTFDHDPSLGYRKPKFTNLDMVNNGASDRDEIDTQSDAIDSLGDEEWEKQNMRLQQQHKLERESEYKNLERYQKLRVLALRPAVSPLRPQSVSLLSPLNKVMTSDGVGEQLKNSVPLLQAQNHQRSSNGTNMSEDEATVVPFENRVVMSVGSEQNVLPPYTATATKQDLALVEEWANRMEAFLNRKYHRNSIEYVEEAKLFYNSYFHESIRRVVKLDANLGQLMTRVMKSYMANFDHAMDVKKKEMDEMQNNFENEIMSLHLKYEKAMKEAAKTSGRPMGNHLMAAALLYKKKQNLGQIIGQGMPRGINRLRKATMKMSGTIKLGLSMKKQREAQALHERAANGLFDVNKNNENPAVDDASESEVGGDTDDEEDDTNRKRRAILHGNKFSGVDRNLENLYNELTGNVGKSPDLTRFDDSEDNTEWVKLSGATVDIAHFSAMAIPNVDLTHVLNRGQRIRIGPKRFVVNMEGDFYPSCIPLSEIWKGSAGENLPVYIDKKACRSKYDDDSDMEPDEDEEWRLVPATGTVNSGEAVVFTSCDVRGIIHRGSKVKIGRHLFQVGHYGTFSEDEFPLGSQWIGEGGRNMPIYVLEEKDENGQEKKYADEEEEKKAEDVSSPWVILHGVTLNLKEGKAVAKANADLRHVLQRGKLISLDHEVFTIKHSGDFTATKIPLDVVWPHRDREGVQIKIRRRDADAMVNVLHASFRVLGIKSDKSGVKKDVGVQADMYKRRNPVAVKRGSDRPIITIIPQKSEAGEKKENYTEDNRGSTIESEPENEYFLPNTTSSQTQMTFADMDTLAMNASSVFPDDITGAKKLRKKKANTTAADKAVNSMSKCLEKFQKVKRKKLLPKRIVLKTIALIIADKISADMKDSNDQVQESMPQYLIDWFFHKYGMKKIADKQLARFVMSMKKVKKHPRVNLFQKLIGMHPSGENLHQLADTKLALNCLVRLKASSLNGIQFLHERHKKDHIPLECSMVVAFEMLRKQLVRSSQYTEECVFDQRTWPDLSKVTPDYDGSMPTADKNIENFLANAFASIQKIGRDAPGLEKVEEIRKFVYVKRSLGSHARDDYKTIISKSVYLYTYIEKFVYLMKTSGKIEAEAARTHLRSAYIQFEEGLDGQISFDEFKAFAEEAFGKLIAGFSKKKCMRMYKRSLSSDDSGTMSEGSFMEMINKYFTDQDLAELLRSKVILAVPMSPSSNAEAEGNEGPCVAEDDDDDLSLANAAVSMAAELDDSDNEGVNDKGVGKPDDLKSAADYEIIIDAWEDEKDIIDAHVHRLRSAKTKDSEHFLNMVNAFKDIVQLKRPDKLEELWTIFRTLTTMARREKAYQGLRTTLKVKKFAANLLRKTAESKLKRLTSILVVDSKTTEEQQQ